MNETREIRDVIGILAKEGDWIVFQSDFQILVDRIKSIGDRHIKTEKNMSILDENFLIINCIINENPERFI
jgi:hypothetical protein